MGMGAGGRRRTSRPTSTSRRWWTSCWCILIIFMVITPFLQQGVSVALPRDMRNPDEDPAIIKETSVVVAITADDKIFLGKKPIEMAELKTEVDAKMASKERDQRIVYVRSDINTNYGTVVNVINNIRDAGVDQIGLVADKKKGGGAAPAPAGGAPAPAPGS